MGEEIVLGAREVGVETVPGFTLPQFSPPPPAIVSVPSEDLPDLGGFSSQEPTVVNKMAPEFETLDDGMVEDEHKEDYPETAEGRNQAILAPLVEGLDEELNRKGLRLVMSESVEEKLCSPRWWAQTRQGLSTADAFDRLVRDPLIRRVQGNEFYPGDSIEIYCNDGFDPTESEIDFRQKK